MDANIKLLINEAVLSMIEHTSSNKKIHQLEKKHTEKIHFIPKKYRIFGGLLQSLNIQFGNFIEELMATFIANDSRYEIIKKYSGKKSNKFEISLSNDSRIDSYISKCQTENIDINIAFPKLLQEIVLDTDTNIKYFKHDIDLLFKDNQTGVIYYLEEKYNDDHDTGKFVDINRKFIKTYAYLAREFNINKFNQIIPILFFFTNKKMKGNIYVPEKTNIRRGNSFFEEFLEIQYTDVDNYMSNLSESDDVIKMFNELYDKIMQSK